MALTRNSDAVAPVRASGPISIWATRHVSTSIGALGRLSRQPFSSLMIVLVIAVTLALPASIHLVIQNARALSGSWDNALDFSVYLKQDLTVVDAEALGKLLGQRADVDSIEVITAEAALAEFKQQSGFGEALEQLSKNPLPHALIVRPGAGNTSASIGLLQEEIGNLPEVEIVQIDTDWAEPAPRDAGGQGPHPGHLGGAGSGASYRQPGRPRGIRERFDHQENTGRQPLGEPRAT